MEALASQQHNPAAVLQQHSARASGEHLHRAELGSHCQLPSLGKQHFNQAQSMKEFSAPAPCSSYTADHDSADVVADQTQAAAVRRGTVEFFMSSNSFGVAAMCAACTAVLFGLACRLMPHFMGPIVAGGAFSSPSDSSSDTGPPDTCIHSPTSEAISNKFAQSWLAGLLAATLAAAAVMMARPAFAVAPLPVRLLAMSCIARTRRVLVMCAVVVAALPAALRPPLWTLLVALPTVATSSMYMHARAQRLRQAAAQPEPPGSLQYAAAVTAVTAATCAAACVLAVMPPSMHVPLWGMLRWAAVATGAMVWALAAAPLLLIALAGLQRACAHAHVLQTAGVARAALLGCRVSELEDLKRQLLLSFTHELNTPLHEVMGCLDALMSATGSSSLPGTTLPLAHTAHSSAHRAARLVRSMTDAVQIHHKRLDVSCASVNLLGIAQMLQAVDWGPPVAHVASYADSSASDRSVASSTTRADASASAGSSDTQHSHSQQSRAGSVAGTSGAGGGGGGGGAAAAGAPPGRSSCTGGSGNAVEKLGSGLGIVSWTGGLKRQLVVSVPPEAEFVHADGDRLLQVMYELVSNGFKFSTGAVELHATVAKGCAVISVKDNGCGIPGDEITKVWGPFHQVADEAQRGASRSGDGLGLGLYLVDQILRAHGVVPTCDSGPGRGTCISFKLPLASAGSAAPASMSPAPSAPSSSLQSSSVQDPCETPRDRISAPTEGLDSSDPATPSLMPSAPQERYAKARAQHGASAPISAGSPATSKQPTPSPSPPLSLHSPLHATPELTAALAAAANNLHSPLCSSHGASSHSHLMQSHATPDNRCNGTEHAAEDSPEGCDFLAIRRRASHSVLSAPSDLPPNSSLRPRAAAQGRLSLSQRPSEDRPRSRLSEASQRMLLSAVSSPAKAGLAQLGGTPYRHSLDTARSVPFCALLGPFSPHNVQHSQQRKSSFGCMRGVGEDACLASRIQDDAQRPALLQDGLRFTAAGRMSYGGAIAAGAMHTPPQGGVAASVGSSFGPATPASDSAWLGQNPQQRLSATRRSVSVPDAMQRARELLRGGVQAHGGEGSSLEPVECGEHRQAFSALQLPRSDDREPELRANRCMCGGSCSMLPSEIRPGTFGGDAATDEEAKQRIHQAFFMSLGFLPGPFDARCTVTHKGPAACDREARDTAVLGAAVPAARREWLDDTTCAEGRETEGAHNPTPPRVHSSGKAPCKRSFNIPSDCCSDPCDPGKGQDLAHASALPPLQPRPPLLKPAENGHILLRDDTAKRAAAVAAQVPHVDADACDQELPVALPSFAPVAGRAPETGQAPLELTAQPEAPIERQAGCFDNTHASDLSEAALKLQRQYQGGAGRWSDTHVHCEAHASGSHSGSVADQEASVLEPDVAAGVGASPLRFSAVSQHARSAADAARCGAAVAPASQPPGEGQKTTQSPECSEAVQLQAAGTGGPGPIVGAGSSVAGSSCCGAPSERMASGPPSETGGSVDVVDVRRRGQSLDLERLRQRRRKIAKERSTLDGASRAQWRTHGGLCMPADRGSAKGGQGGLFAEDAGDEGPRQAPRIMVVDDNAVNQLVLSRMLQSADMHVVIAMSGAEALQKLEAPAEELPDLLIMDVMMPGLSGLELCREVRRRYSDSVLPAIFVSSNSRPEHIVDGLAAGAQDYMTKPVNKSELIARVQSHLSSSRTIERAAVHLAEQLLEEQFQADEMADTQPALSSS